MLMNGRSSGRVRNLQRCQPLAPSMRAASKISRGSEDRPPRNTVTENGIETRIPIAISIGNAVPAVASHATGSRMAPKS